MSTKLKRKTALMIAIEVASLILLYIFLVVMQTNLSVQDQKKDTQSKLQQMDQLFADADESAAQTTASYDDVYRAKAASAAYMIQKQADSEYSDAKSQQYREILDVTNVVILDNSGNIMAKALDTPADFTQSRYNQLRNVFGESNISEPFEVVKNDQCFRYYGARIDDQTMIAVEQDPAELHQLLDADTTWESVLGNVSVGLEGYAFCISNKDYTFLYHPDETLVGKDALDAGISVSDLEDNNYTWLTVNGEKLYCGIKATDDAYVVCAVTNKEIASSRAVTVGMVLFTFFAVMTIVIIYAVLMLREEERTGKREPRNYTTIGSFYFNKMIGRKIGTVCLVGLVCLLLISFYMQTLFSLSRQSMSSNQHVSEVRKAISENKEEIELITEQYNSRYLNKCRIAAYILNNSPELASKNDLTEMSRVLDVQHINVFDNSGTIVATSSSYKNFKLSDDPESQSYEFGKLLSGTDHLIQKAQDDEASGTYCQYIGVSLRDAEDNTNGFVQISVTPSKLQEALANTQISKILDGIRVGATGFAFALDKEDKTFAYYPEERLIGKKAAKYGLTEDQMTDGYCDYITIGTDKYYGSCLETDNYYVYVVVPEKEMTGERAEITLASSAICLICLAIVFLLLTLYRRPATHKETADSEDSDRIIDVVMPDGSTKKTESAASRWDNLSIGWNEKTPEEQVFSIVKVIFSVLAIGICLAVIFKDSIFDSNSIFSYVLNGGWSRGVNIFAMTGCIMIVCVVSVVTMLLRKLLKLMSRTFSARGETVCRLVSSFLKYISVIAMLYYCFALFGVDTATLLASAGILSLVIGLGAKELVSDIIAGLFIIFEGEFRVGDIVTIGDWRGTVVEIGVRTTKIEDGSQNIKIISNSNVSDVINMTRRYSYAWCDVGIEYGESLERVENILEKEFPNIKKRLPSIVDGPFYKGVVALGDSSVSLRVMVQCTESDRIQLERDLRRQMKLICDKYDINIPFPQIVLNEPAEFVEATKWEKMRAEKFNEKQKELSKDLKEEH